jgi:hypothetical protein
MNQSRVADAFLGQWQVQCATTLQTGNPFNVTQACNRANTNSGSLRPDLLHNPNSLPHHRSSAAEVAEWFNTSAFVNVCPGADSPFSFGSVPAELSRRWTRPECCATSCRCPARPAWRTLLPHRRPASAERASCGPGFRQRAQFRHKASVDKEMAACRRLNNIQIVINRQRILAQLILQ